MVVDSKRNTEHRIVLEACFELACSVQFLCGIRTTSEKGTWSSSTAVSSRHKLEEMEAVRLLSLLTSGRVLYCCCCWNVTRSMPIASARDDPSSNDNNICILVFRNELFHIQLFNVILGWVILSFKLNKIFSVISMAYFIYKILARENQTLRRNKKLSWKWTEEISNVYSTMHL